MDAPDIDAMGNSLFVLSMRTAFDESKKDMSSYLDFVADTRLTLDFMSIVLSERLREQRDEQ